MADPLFSMYRGDDHAIRITFKDSQGVAIDITGWTVWATMKLHTEQTDDEAAVKVDLGAQSGVLAESGVLELVLPREQTKNLLPTEYYFDIQREANGAVTTLVNGSVTVKPDVTQRTV